MKQAKCIILFVFIVVKTSFSQITTDNRQSYIGASIGIAPPIGTYANKNIYNAGAGFATLGMRFEGSIAKIIQRYWGIALNYKNQTNNINQQTLSVLYAQKYGVTNCNIVGITPWKINTFLIGSYNAIPLGDTKLVSLELKLLLGMMLATSPQTEITGVVGNNSFQSGQYAINAKAFAYSVGVGIRFEVSKTIFFILQGDCLGAKPKFKTSSIFPSLLSTPYSLNTSTQAISTLSFSICFAYRIN